MNSIYNTYDRFIEAAKKFPRWNNTRRRPTKSTGGKLLQSIVEEIGMVEDAIIEYKKDFFIVNYIGKENTIVDYLYSAQIGNVSDITKLKITSLSVDVTEDKEEFYKNKDLAYYQDGILILRNNVDSITYSIDDYVYSSDVEKFHVWNIFDEFAWWVRLERFENETNKELMARTIAHFRNRSNSSEQGLKNVIKNALINFGNIDDDEIVFETPNEDNMQLNNNGISLYDEISKFNRDIARTKQWDIDYWDNTFRTLNYIPHKWDADVKFYQDGVGYNDSLFVSTVKDLDINKTTNVEIKGYKKSTEKIEEYIKSNNINKNIELTLKKYDDTVNPIPVQYKINASTLTEIDNASQITIESYLTDDREKEIEIMDVDYGEDNDNLKIKLLNTLEENKKYTIKLVPKELTMEIEGVYFEGDNCFQDIKLEPNKNFDYDNRGFFVNKSIEFYGNKITDFYNLQNFKNNRYYGIELESGRSSGSFDINIKNNSKALPLLIETSCPHFSIMDNGQYVKHIGFEFINGSYVSSSRDDEPSTMTIEGQLNHISLDIAKYSTSSLQTPYIDFELYVDGELDDSSTLYNVPISRLPKFEKRFYRLKNIKAVIRRKNNVAIKISNISICKYEVKVITDNGTDISPNLRESVTIPAGTKSVNVELFNYGKTTPIIKHVLVGPKLSQVTSTYSFNINTTGVIDPVLYIYGNCDVQIHNDTDNVNLIDWKMSIEYTNISDENQPLFINLNDYEEIYFSEPEIKKSNNGTYINLEPGKTISSMVIYGKSSKLQEVKTIESMTGHKSLYTNKDLKSLVINNKELFRLNEEKCSSKEADTYKINFGKYSTLQACFVINEKKNVESIKNEHSGRFDYIYIYDKNSVDYIAYNTQNIIKQTTEDVSIIRNFLPNIPGDKKVAYIVESSVIKNDNTFNIGFGDKNWAISATEKLTIKTDSGLIKADTISTVIKNLNHNFALSNSIRLEDAYFVDAEQIELSRYIITPPDNMSVIYEESETLEERHEDGTTMYVENDGFNKLPHSNIVRINKILVDNTELSSDEYSLLQEEGIICWNNDSHFGKKIQVEYVYKKPIYLTFNSIEYLYDIVGHDIDTFKEVDTVNKYVIENVADGNTTTVDYGMFKEQPEKIVVKCSNPCYIGSMQNGDKVLVKKIAEDNNLVIHNGYYYINGDEYWYFADKKETVNERTSGITYFNVEKGNNVLVLRQQTENLLPNSKMKCDKIDTHCIIDFNNYRNIPNISSFDHVGACESFANWHSYKMNVNISDNFDGNSLILTSEDENAYAILDVTKISKDKLVSCWVNGTLKVYAGTEVKISDLPLVKGLYVKKVAEFNQYKDKYYYDFGSLDEDLRKYIIVEGSGVLIEILATDDKNIESIEKDHEKAINKFGINIEEKSLRLSNIELDFSEIGMEFKNLELTKDLAIQAGSTVDWGITKINNYDLEKDVNIDRFILRNDALISQSNNAWVETKQERIEFKKAIQNLILKVNDYHYGELSGFTITAYGSNTNTGKFIELTSISDSNVLIMPQGKLMDYMKFKIIAQDGKVINDIELYAQYKETEEQSLKVSTHSSGDAITKIYKVDEAKKYIANVKILESELEDNISLFVRAFKNGESSGAWTEWYDIKERHIFDGYKLFQFKIKLSNKDAKIKIDKFILEVQ